MGWISIFLLPMVKTEEEGFRCRRRKGKGSCDIYIDSIFVPKTTQRLFRQRDRHLGVICDFWYFQGCGISEDIMSSHLTPTYTPRRDDETDESPPPYSLNPTDEVTLEVGPTRPFPPPPQQPLLQQQHLRPPPGERGLSDFARDFYAATTGASRSTESLPHRPPLHRPQNSIPDDGKPTRTPVPGHPLLNDGKTLVYPSGYECNKCLSFPLSKSCLHPLMMYIRP